MTEQTTELVRAENGDYLCDVCGTGYKTEAEARECGRCDREQWSKSGVEDSRVKQLMGS